MHSLETHPIPARLLQLITAAALTLAAMLGTSVPTAAWIGVDGPYPGNYDTHDWVIDQALKVLDGRADSWFDASAARNASDDPDNTDDHSYDHVYRDTGIRGGAVQRVVDHYAAAVHFFEQHRYADASVQIGLLSHYYTDMLQPYHSNYDGIGQTSAHRNYELMVEDGMDNAASHPEWSSSRRTVSQISNIRSEAIAAADYSRGKFSTLHPAVVASPGSISGTSNAVTRDVLRRGAEDLADIIWSISRKVGEAPLVDRLTASVKWRYPSKTEDFQGVYVTARDSGGHAIEGLEVMVTLPWGETVPLYTDGAGEAKWSGPPRSTPYYSKQTVTLRATTDGHTETTTTWWATSPTPADGLAGFSTKVNDRSPAAGEYVTVSSTLRDTAGRPIVGIPVDWTWDYGHTTIVTTALTNSSGVASSRRLITSATTHERVTIRAHAQSGSHNRNSSAWFERDPNDKATPYKGWFIDIWGSKFRDDIVWLAEAGITTGCDEELFCPDGRVTRAQMATFLTRALDLPATSHDYFTDDNDVSHEWAINRLRAAGITFGCGGNHFCPVGLVTRAQMASFLTRALDLHAASHDYFSDDRGLSHEDAINRLAASGITSGCGPDRFCPDGIVTRGQMAAFLHRGLDD